MRFEFILITIVTLAVVATCTPLQTTPKVTRIPLSQPGSFIKRDGSFDLDGIMGHMDHVENKYRRNWINFRRNVGREAFNDSADIEPFPAVPVGLQRRQATTTKVSFTNYNDKYRTGTIIVGNAWMGGIGQQFTVAFDTGSADFWLTGKDCTGGGVNKNQFDASRSSTSLFKGGPDISMYFKKIPGGVRGKVFTDTVQVGEVIVDTQFFVYAEAISDSFRDAPYDGILGMAPYKEIAFSQQRPFFHAAVHDYAVERAIFTFALGKTNSELYLGGIDKDRCNGDIEYHDMVSFYWGIGSAKVTVGKKTIVTGATTLIDSGSSLILGSPNDIKAFFKAIPGSKSNDGTEDGKTIYQYPCDTPPDFKISWGTRNREWSVLEENFRVGEKPSEPGKMCKCTVAAADFLYDGEWILGDAFMRNVYTVFDYEKGRVGFASPVD